MSAPARLLRGLAAGLSVLCAGAFVARLPGLGPFTLGLLSERFGSVVLGAAGATFAGVLVWRGRGGLLGSAVVTLMTYALDADVTRRRSALIALLCLVIPWVLHAILDLRKERRLPWVLSAAAAWTGVTSIQIADRSPHRTSLPPIDAATPAPDAPNIVLITMDTTRYDALFGDGSEERVPHIRQFADSALRFTNAIAEASHTHPSMASLLTSRFPIEHGSISTSPAIDPAIPTLASHLRRAGYRTAGFLENPWLGPDFGLSEGYEYLHHSAQISRIEAWLRRESKAPAFLHVHLFEPHGPYELRKPLWPRPPKGPWLDARARLGDTISAEFIRQGEVPGAHGLGPEDFAWLQDVYLSEVSAMDLWFDEFIYKTEYELGENTIFAITADHGEEFGDHGALHHGHTLYRELVHVPLLFRIPGVAPGETEMPAGLVDIAPTLLAAASLPPLPNAAGRSLLAAEPSSRPLVSTRFFKDGEHLFAIQSGEWKLICRTRDSISPAATLMDIRGDSLLGSMELYLWSEDPRERHNLIGEQPEAFTELHDRLHEWSAQAKKRRAQDAAGGPPREPSQATYEALRSLGYSSGDGNEE